MGKPDDKNLNDLLMVLADFGSPTIRHSTIILGWSADIKLSVAHVGASFDVASKNGHATPLDAAEELLQRVWDCVGKTIMKAV